VAIIRSLQSIADTVLVRGGIHASTSVANGYNDVTIGPVATVVARTLNAILLNLSADSRGVGAIVPRVVLETHAKVIRRSDFRARLLVDVNLAVGAVIRGHAVTGVDIKVVHCLANIRSLGAIIGGPFIIANTELVWSVLQASTENNMFIALRKDHA